MRIVIALAAWVAAAIATVYAARFTAIGPVVMTVGPAQGIHAGDIATGILAAAWATIITIALVHSAATSRRQLRHDQRR